MEWTFRLPTGERRLCETISGKESFRDRMDNNLLKFDS